MPEDKLSAALRADLWPRGVKCREWLLRVPNVDGAGGRPPDDGDDDADSVQEDDNAFADAEETEPKRTQDGASY